MNQFLWQSEIMDQDKEAIESQHIVMDGSSINTQEGLSNLDIVPFR